MFIVGNNYLFVCIITALSFVFASGHLVPPSNWQFPLLSRVNDDALLARDISSGKVQGTTIKTSKNTTGYAFFAIPIAEPPTGKHRFRAPVPRKPWTNVLDATKPGVSCYWNTSETSNVPSDYIMNEDCIYVNVFTNRHCLLKGNCAVVYYVHGGAMQYGTTLQYNSTQLTDNFNSADRNVVFVNINFRQALFAALNPNNKLDLPIDLNAGFHDIVHGLRWVKKEIPNFGGNPDHITVMGHSGGAIFTQLLMISPQSKYLFNQAVLMSAVVNDGGLIPSRNERASRMAAKILNCTDADTNNPLWNNKTFVISVIECMRVKPALDVSMAQKALDGTGALIMFLAQDSGDNALFPGGFDKLYSEIEQIKVLSGTTSKEYLYSRDIVYHPNGNKKILEINETRLTEHAVKSLRIYGCTNLTQTAVDRVSREYHSVPRSIYLYDDVDTYVPMRNFATHVTKHGGTSYLYEFSYDKIGNAFVKGAQSSQFSMEETPHHGQDLVYVVGQHIGNFTAKDHQIQYLYSQIFVDFINNGSPENHNRHWNKFSQKENNYFVIDFPDPNLTMPGERNEYHQKALNFWNHVVPKLIGLPHSPKTEQDIKMLQPLPRLPTWDVSDLPFSAALLTVPQQSTNISDEKTTFVETSHEEDYDDEDEDNGVYRPPQQDTTHSGINWVITTWIGMGIIILLAISHAITCVKLRSKRNEYQYI